MAQFDGFVFDAFGVLNTGPVIIPGAVERIGALKAAGKQVLVLSNAATASHGDLTAKYQRLGFPFQAQDIVSSRWLLEQALAADSGEALWGVIGPDASSLSSLPLQRMQPVQPDTPTETLDRIDRFVFLSSEGWDESLHERVEESLKRNPRPLAVANPDLVAPRGDALTLEPGYFAHRLADTCGCALTFYGKPFGNAFEAALARMPGLLPRRILMVGDTLHTDILGAQAVGMATLLVTGYGSLKGMDIPDCLAQSGIVPDFQVPAI